MNKNRTILVISNNAQERYVYESIIPPEELTIVGTGQEGLNYLRYQPSIVFVDLRLPDMTAIEWLHSIRGDLPPYTILVAPRDTAKEKVAAMKAGASDIVENRSHEMFEVTIKMALSKAKRQSSAVTRLQLEIERASDLVLKCKLSSFQLFLENKRYSGQPVKPFEILGFFPDADLEGITPEAFSNAVRRNDLKSIIKMRQPQVLIVDDEPNLRKVISDMLGNDFFMTQASNATEALSLLEKGQPFDTAIVDVGLPDTRGDHLAGQLKSKDPQMDVIMLTAFEDPELIVNCFNRGAIDYILKPFDNDDLRRKVLSHFEQKLIRYVLDANLKKFERHYQIEKFPFE